jgi:glycosyltransferase involved in cell wall biosynthesis
VTPDRNVVFAVEPQEWVDRITELLADPERRRRIGGEARALVEERYSFAAIGARLADLFDDVAGQASVMPSARKYSSTT